MTQKTIPHDIARCDGIRVSNMCPKCLRKTSPPNPNGLQPYIYPQVEDTFDGGEYCPNYIGSYK